MIVIDANVAVRWFLPEPLSDAAEALLGEPRVRIAPEHILVEVGQVLGVAERTGKISLSDVRSAVGMVCGLVQVLPTRDLIDLAVVIATETGCSTYDALYVAAAERNDAAFVTADVKLFRQLTAANRLGATRILGA